MLFQCDCRNLFLGNLKSVAFSLACLVIYTNPFNQGWANEDCQFNPQKGIGVGDTNNSCGFDGTRCKVWSGPSVDVFAENDYGL